uniref:Band 7 protein n=1 Tax=Ascaris lumbricoides TaxID=6252 RepID=A0A0M3HP14_ASCLU
MQSFTEEIGKLEEAQTNQAVVLADRARSAIIESSSPYHEAAAVIARQVTLVPQSSPRSYGTALLFGSRLQWFFSLKAISKLKSTIESDVALQTHFSCTIAKLTSVERL